MTDEDSDTELEALEEDVAESEPKKVKKPRKSVFKRYKGWVAGLPRRQRVVVILATIAFIIFGLIYLSAVIAYEPWSTNEFQADMATKLRDRRLDVWPSFAAAGTQIDLVVSRGTSHSAVLCDGLASVGDLADDPLVQHRILARAGWTVRRIPERTWMSDWHSCVDYVVKSIQ